MYVWQAKQSYVPQLLLSGARCHSKRTNIKLKGQQVQQEVTLQSLLGQHPVYGRIWTRLKRCLKCTF